MRRPDLRRAGLVLVGLGVVFAPAGCSRKETMPGPSVHYVVGPPWQGDRGAWFYPSEHFGGTYTGLAVPLERPAGTLTADGERFDPHVAMAALQSLQLPVILRVTDLDTGRQIEVRANERGPSSPGRVVALDARAMALLGMPVATPTPVQIEIDAAASQRLASNLHGGPHLDVATAPLGDVSEAPLPAPGAGSAPAARMTPSAATDDDPFAPTGGAEAPLPETVTQFPVRAHALWLDAGTFSGAESANTVAEAIGGTAESDGGGRHPTYSVRRGPLPSVAAADAALDQARAAGISGVRIVVE